MGRGRGGRKKKSHSAVDSSASESKPPSSPLACLICSCHTNVSDSEVLQFYDFVFDPTAEPRNYDGEGFMPLSPRFRLDGLQHVQICISNSILYVFEELDCFSFDIGQTIYSFDLSVVLNESSTEMVMVEKAMLEKCSEMTSPKPWAKAIPTPKGKILIFSLFTTPVALRNDYGGYELFDPDTKQCRSLPQLPITTRRLICGYGFLGDSLFMISTDLGKFAFDLYGNNGWQEDFRYPHTPSSYFMSYAISLSGFVRIEDGRATPLSRFDPPLSRFPESVIRPYPERFPSLSFAICLLGADKELMLCIAQAAFVHGESNDPPCILFDVYRSDSDLTRKNKASFRFTADIPGQWQCLKFAALELFKVNANV